MRTDIQLPKVKWPIPYLAIFIGASLMAWGQANSASLPARSSVPRPAIATASKAVPIPQHLIYRMFLAYQNHLDEVGARLQEQGEDGTDFRDHFQRILGFSTVQYAPVRTAAQRLAARLKLQDEKIQAVIDTGRAQQSRTLKGPGDIPAPPPELAQLQIERDALIKREVARMNAALGIRLAAQVQALVERDVAAHVQLLPLHPPAVHDPAKTSLAPFPNGNPQ